MVSKWNFAAALLLIASGSLRNVLNDFNRAVQLSPNGTNLYRGLALVDEVQNNRNAPLTRLHKYVTLAGQAADPKAVTLLRQLQG